eukprot:CAMPEP_0184395452 /NCGR_PEP_ID=MMETSP0007-20130409/44274_1 /TAXON_ID=97485 /ORGANISM="Prymnesium parvum, Strain Texoma1" /LENGTH=90 /DNA_ID=CAMNT_0026747613 /DNA_START=179 /DNA_END=447 /DNA_ORIENTATION=+
MLEIFSMWTREPGVHSTTPGRAAQQQVLPHAQAAAYDDRVSSATACDSADTYFSRAALFSRRRSLALPSRSGGSRSERLSILNATSWPEP